MKLSLKKFLKEGWFEDEKQKQRDDFRARSQESIKRGDPYPLRPRKINLMDPIEIDSQNAKKQVAEDLIAIRAIVDKYINLLEANPGDRQGRQYVERLKQSFRNMVTELNNIAFMSLNNKRRNSGENK